jgi:very-short-patch-repair endonuclease
LIGQTNKKISEGKLPQTLRKTMTEAERTLWRELRQHQISGVKFRRQHPYGDYILDFVSLEIGLVIEVDGGQHSDQAEYDALRTRELEQAGFSVLRFWNNDVLNDIQAVKENIWFIVQHRLNETHPHPSPPLEREGA